MSAAIKAGAYIFAIAQTVGFLLGTLRTLLLYPLFGEALAVGLELPLMLTIFLIACAWVIWRYRGCSSLQKAGKI